MWRSLSIGRKVHTSVKADLPLYQEKSWRVLYFVNCKVKSKTCCMHETQTWSQSLRRHLGQVNGIGWKRILKLWTHMAIIGTIFILSWFCFDVWILLSFVFMLCLVSLRAFVFLVRFCFHLFSSACAHVLTNQLPPTICLVQMFLIGSSVCLSFQFLSGHCYFCSFCLSVHCCFFLFLPFCM